MASSKQLYQWVIATTAAYKVLSKTIGQAGGISTNQYRILARLQAFDRFDQLRELANTLDLHPSTVTMTIKELESMNLVKTDWTKEDRRSTIVLCTNRSRQLIEEIDHEIVKCVHQIWALYSADELLLTYYDSLHTAANRRMLSKYDLSLDKVERAFAESVFVSYTIECRAVKQYHISLSCFKVLASLAEAPQGLSPIALSDECFLRPPEVSECLKKLEQTDYISRQKSQSDQRYTYAKVTEQGIDLLENKISPDLSRSLRALVPEESKEKAYQYYTIAEKIIAAMKKTRDSVF